MLVEKQASRMTKADLKKGERDPISKRLGGKAVTSTKTNLGPVKGQSPVAAALAGGGVKREFKGTPSGSKSCSRNNNALPVKRRKTLAQTSTSFRYNEENDDEVHYYYYSLFFNVLYSCYS